MINGKGVDMSGGFTTDRPRWKVEVDLDEFRIFQAFILGLLPL
jgi:hypothetical protein